MLCIFGEGVEQSDLATPIRRFGQEHRAPLLGFVANPWAWYARCAALVLGSHWEGMPNVAGDTLASGTPVVVTPESGGLVELLPLVNSGDLTTRDMQSGVRAALTRIPIKNPGAAKPSQLPAEHGLDAVRERYWRLFSEPLRCDK